MGKRNNKHYEGMVEALFLEMTFSLRARRGIRENYSITGELDLN